MIDSYVQTGCAHVAMSVKNTPNVCVWVYAFKLLIDMSAVSSGM